MYYSKIIKHKLYKALATQGDKVFEVKLHFGCCDSTEVNEHIFNMRYAWKKIAVARRRRDLCNNLLGYLRRIEIEQDSNTGQYFPFIRLIGVYKHDVPFIVMKTNLTSIANRKWFLASNSGLAQVDVRHITSDEYKTVLKRFIRKKTAIEEEFLESIKCSSQGGIFSKDSLKGTYLK